jgi:hypothetical protein
MGIYIVIIVAVIALVTFPVIYFGQIDGTSAMVIAGGTALLIWTLVRSRSLKK